MRLTIGIPIYNGANYLRRCLDSILAQDDIEDGFEVICVDDGSTDESLAILMEYQRGDSRIRIFHTENAGSFMARWKIIDEALGEWIGFVDCDDEVLPGMYRGMLAKAESEPEIDLVFCAFEKVDFDSGRDYGTFMTAFGNEVFFLEQEMGLLGAANVAMWNKLFRTNYIRDGIRLETPPRIMEDMIFVSSVYPKMRNVAFMNESFYLYYDHQKSVTKRIGRKELDEAKQNALFLKKFFEERNYENDFLNLMIFNHVGVALLINYSEERKLKEIFLLWAEMRKYLSENFPKWRQCRYLKRKYVLKNRQLWKSYICFLEYNTVLMPLMVALYRFLEKKFALDLKW